MINASGFSQRRFRIVAVFVTGIVLASAAQALRRSATVPCAAAEAAGPARIRERLSLSGVISARRHAQVAPSVTGLVERVEVRRGDRVVMGQRLVRLAADDLQLEVQRRHVAVLRAQRDLERLSSNDQKVPGDRTDRELRQAELTLAVTEKAAAVRRLNARDLRAPFAGRVLQIPVAEGQLMAPGGGGVYVVEPESLFLEIEGDEFEIRGLRPDIEGVAFLEGVVSASLKIRVRTSPALKRLRVGSGAPALFSVEADILSSGSAELQPGLTAHVDLLIRDAVVPVAVPLRYVEFRNRSASIIVCSQAGPPEEREVTLGGTDSQFAEIRTNLTVGERVLMRRKS